MSCLELDVSFFYAMKRGGVGGVLVSFMLRRGEGGRRYGPCTCLGASQTPEGVC